MASTTLKEVLDKAMELSADERFELTQLLLDEEDGWYAAIEPELDEISAAIESGDMKTYSIAEVKSRLRERLARRAD